MIAQNNVSRRGGRPAGGPQPTQVDPGHTLDTATALSLQPGVPLVLQEQVGGAQDPADLYRFDLAQEQPIRIALQGDQGDVDLLLLDAQGNVIAESVNGGLDLDSLEGSLPAGTYYVAVVPYEGTQTTYSVSIETGATGPVGPIRPEVDPGHNLETAMALPLQPGVPLMVQDQVGGAQDPADLYRFDLAQDQPVRIALQGDQADVDLLLLDAQGNVIAESVNGGLDLDSLEGSLPAGTYYVAVVPYEGAETTYSVSIEAGTTSTGGTIRPEVDPGHTLETAMALPLQPGGSLTVQDQVGGAQDPADVYRFDLAQEQGIRIALQGDQGDVDLLLLDEQGNVIAESVNGGLEVDSLEGGLPAGTYHVAVVPYEGAQTSYSLSIETGAAEPGAATAAMGPMPESLALRDSTGLGTGGAASTPFGPSRDATLAGQLLAAA